MLYRIRFANDTVGKSQLPPFEVHTAEGLGASARNSDLSRRIRSVIVDALTSAPAPGAATAQPVIAAHTQVVLSLTSGEGSAYYGSTTLGRFSIHPVQ